MNEELLRAEGVAVRDTFEHSRLVIEHLNALAIAAAHG